MVTENDFIDGLRSGDQIKFGQFMRKHIPALTFHAYKICGDKEVSEEIVADAFTKLWNLKENFENETKVKAFLFITTRNACLDYLRSATKRNERATTDLSNEQIPDEQNPLNQIIYAELIQTLIDHISRLPIRQAEVFTLSYFEHLSTEEICQRLGITPNAVFQARKKALIHLRQSFKTNNLLTLIFVFELTNLGNLH